MRLPKIMSSVREPMLPLLNIFILYPHAVTFLAFGALIYGIKSKRRTGLVTPGILLLLLIQSAVMNYFTFVNGLPAYLILTFFLSCLTYCIERAGWTPRLGPAGISNTLRFVILFSSHITAIYFLIYRFVTPPSRA